MPPARIVSRCALALAIGLISFAAAVACTGGDPASPSVPAGEIAVWTNTDADADILEAQAVYTKEAAVCVPGGIPDACPSPPPSWMTNVRFIILERCSPCHFPNGVDDSKRDLSTYENVHSRSGSILSSVSYCVMPPLDSGQLTPSERESLFGWLVCAAPDN